MPELPRRLPAATGSPRSPASPRPTSAPAARMIGEAGDWMSCWTMGLNQSTHGTWNTNAICNLHLATGAICRPGSGPFSLTGQPNAMGGREMGYMGPGLPGQRSVLVGRRPRVRRGPVGAAARAPCAPTSAAAPSTCSSGLADGRDQGLLDHLHQSRCHRGQPQDRDRRAGGRRARRSPRTPTPTPRPTRYADIVLPAALWAEADGVMVNSERNLTLLQQADRRRRARRCRTGS